MSGSPHDVPEFAQRFEAAEPRSRIKAGVVVGALGAALISVGFGWWISGEDRGRMVSSAEATPVAVERPVRPVISVAASAADPVQVRRAYDEVQAVYADGGAPALADFAHECAETLRGDPRILDFCLAFDMYAAALAPKAGEAAQWFQVGEARRLRLTRDALPPGADAEARLAEIGRLMRAATAAPQVASTPSAIIPTAPAEKKQTAVTPPARKPKAAKAVSRCRFEPTPAQRILCGSPQLQTADRRLQNAYSRALKAGADRRILEGEQAAWRAMRNSAADRREMAHLYAQRMRELDQHLAQAN